jgi:hypothetical protein
MTFIVSLLCHAYPDLTSIWSYTLRDFISDPLPSSTPWINRPLLWVHPSQEIQLNIKDYYRYYKLYDRITQHMWKFYNWDDTSYMTRMPEESVPRYPSNYLVRIPNCAHGKLCRCIKK